jgi:sortase (surface protein transpeptidase)
VTIPRIGVSQDLQPIGLNADRSMQLPPDPAKPGWYTKAPMPGELGPAVIAGHVTWEGRPSVFFKLGELAVGHTVEVTRKDGSTAVFAVTRIETVRKDAFPRKAVYGFIDHAGLRLITCGGTFDRESERYLSNVVVYAKLTALKS